MYVAETSNIAALLTDISTANSEYVSGTLTLETEVEFTQNYVCKDGFTFRDAVVACRQLGYRGAAWTQYTEAVEVGEYAPHRFSCTGNEDHLGQCSRTDYDEGEGVCEPTLAAGLACFQSKYSTRY